MSLLKIIDLGSMAYSRALTVQTACVEQAKTADEDIGFLLLVEHDPPVITLGRSAEEHNILLPEALLEEKGIEVHRISRGGDVTYHGPGQVVGYPIVQLDRRGRDIHQYLRNIEEIIIRTIAEFDIAGQRVPGLTGVWVGDEKIAATGIAVTRWVSYHGFALNVAPDLEDFNLIVPCGITDKGVTSLEKLGRAASVDSVKHILARHCAEVLGFSDTQTTGIEALPDA